MWTNESVCTGGGGGGGGGVVLRCGGRVVNGINRLQVRIPFLILTLCPARWGIRKPQVGRLCYRHAHVKDPHRSEKCDQRQTQLKFPQSQVGVDVLGSECLKKPVLLDLIIFCMGEKKVLLGQ